MRISGSDAIIVMDNEVLYKWFTKSLFGDLVNPNKLIL